MSFAQQLLHVLRKDLLRTRYVLLGYGALVVLATYGVTRSTEIVPQAHGEFMVGPGWFTLLPMLLVLVGMSLAAFVVQQDSAVRSDADWLSRPLSGTAVIAAKIMFAAFVLLVPALLAQALAFTMLSASFALRELLPSTWYYGVMLFSSILLAARTRDLKTFTISVFVGAVCFIIFATTVVFGQATSLLWLSPVATVAVVATVLGVSGLAWHYTRRDIGLAGWFPAIASVMMLLVANKLVDSSTLAGRVVRLGASPASVTPSTTLALQLDDRDLATASALPLRLMPTGLAAGMRLDISLTRVRIESANDTVLPRLSDVAMVLGESEFAVPPGTRWLFSEAASADSGRLVLSMNPRAQSRTTGAPRMVTVEGMVHEDARRLVASLNARIGERVETSEGRVEISEVYLADSLALVVTSTAPAFSSNKSWRLPNRQKATVYALVNESRREALRLTPNPSGTSSAMLVLPGATVARQYARLTPTNAPTSLRTAGIDAEWLRGSKLMILEWDPRSSYPFSLRAPLP
jgi:hypothetical protein